MSIQTKNSELKEIKNAILAINQKIDNQNSTISKLATKVDKYQKDFQELEKAITEEIPESEIIIKETEEPKEERAELKQSQEDKTTDRDQYVLDRYFDKEDEGQNIIKDEEPKKTKTKIQEKKDIASVEEAIGGKLFAKFGIVFLIIGISLLLKYAFDNWWGPTERVMTGVVIGAVLLFLGKKTFNKYANYSQLLSGGGITVLYLSVFVAFDFYHLISLIPSFILMTGVTVLAIFLSLRYNAKSLMLISIIGGFATPFLISSGENNYIGLFSYVILLDLAILAVSIFKRWQEINFTGFIGTALVFNSWSIKFYSEELIVPTMIFLTIFFVIYSISSLIYNLIKKEKSKSSEQILVFATAILYFVGGYFILDTNYHNYLGLFSVLIASYYLIGSFLIKKITPHDENLYDFLISTSIIFITLAIFFQFDQFVITMLWFIEAVLLYFIGLRNKNGISQVFGALIFSLGIIRHLLIDPELYTKTSLIIFNKVFAVSVVAIIVSYLIAFLFKKYQQENIKKITTSALVTAVAVFLTIANLLSVYSVSRDIIVYYDNQKEIIEEPFSQGKRPLDYLDTDEYRLYQEKINIVSNQRNLSLSLFWLLYAIILMIVGFFKKYEGAKVGGFFLIFFVAARWFFSDLWFLEQVYRVGVAIGLIVISYLLVYLFKVFEDEDDVEDKFLRKNQSIMFFSLLANLVTVFIVSKEITDYFIWDTASIFLSLFWLAYSIVLISVGIIYKIRYIRISAILLLIISMLKLFFYDLWDLGTLYRIISSISLGIVLLSISFVYQKYRDQIKKII